MCVISMHYWIVFGVGRGVAGGLFESVGLGFSPTFDDEFTFEAFAFAFTFELLGFGVPV